MSRNPITRRHLVSRLTLVTGLVVAALTLAPWASATGSGYNQSYSRAGGSTSVGGVDLTSVKSSDPGGNNVTIQFGVSGVLVLTDSNYIYTVWFGGSSSYNATAYVLLSNSTSAKWSQVSGGSYGYGTLNYTLGSGGSSLSFSIAKSIVGPSGSFGVNVYAIHGTSNSGAYSWLGTNYGGSSGGGTCTSTGCTSTTSTNSAFSGALLYGIVGVVVVLVVVVVVVLLVMKRKKTPPAWSPPPPPPPSPPPP